MLSTMTLKRHAALVDRMATHRGVDLEEAALRGHITTSEIEDAVLACTGCASPDTCEAHLHVTAGQVGEGPEYCRNQDLFDRLAVLMKDA